MLFIVSSLSVKYSNKYESDYKIKQEMHEISRGDSKWRDLASEKIKKNKKIAN